MEDRYANNNISYSDFLNFNREGFSRWLRTNFELWDGNPLTHNFFAPIAGIQWEEDIFESFRLLLNSNDWLKTREYFCEGLEDALNTILPQINDERKRNCAANLINLARVLKENRLIKILNFHIRNNISIIDFFLPVFNGFDFTETLFDLSLRYLSEVPCYYYGVHLWQSLDKLFDEIEKLDNSFLTYERAKNLFFIGLRLKDSHKTLERFINRVNKALYLRRQGDNIINEVAIDLSLQLTNLITSNDDIIKIMDYLENYRKKYENILHQITHIEKNKVILIVDGKTEFVDVNSFPNIPESVIYYTHGVPWFIYAIFNFLCAAPKYQDLNTSNLLYAHIIKEIKERKEKEKEITNNQNKDFTIEILQENISTKDIMVTKKTKAKAA